MAFGDGYFVSRIEVPGFRDIATGALSSDWTLATNTQSTRDIAVKLDTVNICWEPTTGLVSPSVWWKTKLIDFRLYGSLRAFTTVNSHANIFASPVDNVGANFAAGLAYWLDVSQSNNIGTIHAQGGSAVYFSYTVTANLWYRVMLEKAGTHLRFWFNSTGNADPRSLTDSGLSLLRDATVADSLMVQIGISLSPTALSASNYCGACDLLLQVLTERTVETGSTPGGPQLVSPSGVDRRYRHYKSARQAVETFNNLKLGP